MCVWGGIEGERTASWTLNASFLDLVTPTHRSDPLVAHGEALHIHNVFRMVDGGCVCVLLLRVCV